MGGTAAVASDSAVRVTGPMEAQVFRGVGVPFETVAEKLHVLRDAARVLGCVLPEPFLQVAFLALPVIPHLKITDKGMFDVDRFALIE